MASVDQWTLTEFRPRGKSEVWFFRKNLAPDVPVSAVLKPGTRDLLFYTRDPAAFKTFASTLRADYPRLVISTEIIEDPKWTQYADLP
jgi:hypothetical protein